MASKYHFVPSFINKSCCPEQINKSKQIFKQLKMNTIGDILHHEQIKDLIRKILQFDIKHYANPLWFKQDESLQKLNMQLHVNAIMKNDEFILEECIAEDKFKIIIYDLIMTSIWKQKILTSIKGRVSEMNSMKVYLAIYHQSVVCNMLEVLMFHRTAIDESGQFLIEVIDYCYKKILKQVNYSMRNRKAKREQQAKRQKMTAQEKKDEKMNKILKQTPLESLQRQIEQIQFNLFIMSISILRYVTDYIKHLEIGIVHHLLAECNVYSLLVPLIEERPWLRENDNGKWNIIPKAQYGRLPKTEAQVWIAVYNLFMDPECRKKYELNDERKNNLLKLRKFMNEVLLDQIPPLTHMLRSLEELSIMNVPTHLTVNPFVVEQMPIIATQIGHNKDWQQMAEEHLVRLCQSMDESERSQMQRLAQLYTNNNVEGLLEGFKCKKCEKAAYKRCSKCKSVWYCSRECQVGDWPTHKASCNKIAKEQKEAQSKKNAGAVEEEVPKKNLIDELD